MFPTACKVIHFSEDESSLPFVSVPRSPSFAMSAAPPSRTFSFTPVVGLSSLLVSVAEEIAGAAAELESPVGELSEVFADTTVGLLSSTTEAGLESAGFDSLELDSVGFNSAGFDSVDLGSPGLEFDSLGFDSAGFDSLGFDSVDFDSPGLDSTGFDSEESEGCG